mmetsp:Transcript_53782/g.64886  ORF Transcript_53782/g.64886 Transcript_53782/m.64886 type:complete len:247 (-) Transcript_53782:30-770(-)
MSKSASSPVPGMWKPGASAPPPKTPTTSQSNITNSTSSTPKSKTPKGSSGKTKLSGATMGMRFMQRNRSSNKKTTSTSRTTSKKDENDDGDQEIISSSSTIKKEIQSWRTIPSSSHSGDGDVVMQDETNIENVLVSTNGGQIIPQIATPSDMYGIGAEIVGRRSFGGFNKAVESTYNESFELAKASQKGSRGMDMSDDDILQRFGIYIREMKADDDGDIDEAAAAPVGNLGEKIKNSTGKRKRQHA